MELNQKEFEGGCNIEGINSTLFHAMKTHLEHYDCDSADIENFLNAASLDRNGIALAVIKNAMSTHQKGDLFELVSELADVQQGALIIQEQLRDHVSHSVLTFLLGIYLLKEYFVKENRVMVSRLQWKLAGLFHDIAYPVEIATNILAQYTDTVNRIRMRLHNSNIPRFQVLPQGLERLSNNVNGLVLISECCTRWGINVDTESEYQQMIVSGCSNHAILGALSLLNVIDSMYQFNNPKRLYIRCEKGGTDWNQKYFDEDVVPACATIFLHNLHPRCFNNMKIVIQRAPLAFLLKLCDCLQEWERPSQRNPTGLASEQFDINVEHGKIMFTIPIAELKEKIMNEIHAVLDAPFVQVSIR